MRNISSQPCAQHHGLCGRDATLPSESDRVLFLLFCLNSYSISWSFAHYLLSCCCSWKPFESGIVPCQLRGAVHVLLPWPSRRVNYTYTWTSWSRVFRDFLIIVHFSLTMPYFKLGKQVIMLLESLRVQMFVPQNWCSYKNCIVLLNHAESSF